MTWTYFLATAAKEQRETAAKQDQDSAHNSRQLHLNSLRTIDVEKYTRLRTANAALLDLELSKNIVIAVRNNCGTTIDILRREQERVRSRDRYHNSLQLILDLQIALLNTGNSFYTYTQLQRNRLLSRYSRQASEFIEWGELYRDFREGSDAVVLMEAIRNYSVHVALPNLKFISPPMTAESIEIDIGIMLDNISSAERDKERSRRIKSLECPFPLEPFLQDFHAASDELFEIGFAMLARSYSNEAQEVLELCEGLTEHKDELLAVAFNRHDGTEHELEYFSVGLQWALGVMEMR